MTNVSLFQKKFVFKPQKTPQECGVFFVWIAFRESILQIMTREIKPLPDDCTMNCDRLPCPVSLNDRKLRRLPRGH